MGIGGGFSSAPSSEMTISHFRTHKVFLLCNYLVLGLASSCIFLTISLRLLPSLCGLALIFLHALTIIGAVSGCAAANNTSRSGKWYATHMVSTVLTAIFQGSVAVLIFTRTSDFLVGGLKSYVKEEDGAVILRMIGGLCITMFCLEWVLMGLAFSLRYYDYVERGGNTSGGTVTLGAVRKSLGGGDKDWPWPFQVWFALYGLYTCLIGLVHIYLWIVISPFSSVAFVTLLMP